MKTTITVRLDERQQKALSQASRTLGKTASDIVRDALEHALSPDTAGARAAHLKGRLRLRRRGRAAWRTTLKNRNWRP